MTTSKRRHFASRNTRTAEVSREVLLGRYIAETGATVRQAAAQFGVSKSTVHMGVTI
jgi:transposase